MGLQIIRELAYQAKQDQDHHRIFPNSNDAMPDKCKENKQSAL